MTAAERGIASLKAKLRPLKRLKQVRLRHLSQWLRATWGVCLDRVRSRPTLIIHVEELGFIQFLLPVVQALKGLNQRFSYYIATDYASFRKELSVFDVPPGKVFDSAVAKFIGADFFLSPSVYGDGAKKSVKINISHNQPTKFESYPKERLLKYNFHFLTGPLHREQYESMFEKHGIPVDGQLIDVGYPKSDDLLSGKFGREAVLAGLGLDPRRRTVLYAPAWDAGGSLRCFGEQVIERLLQMGDVNVLVKLHPVSCTPRLSPQFEFYTGGVDWMERLSVFQRFPQFRHVLDPKIDPLLSASDVLVTDFSSVALEFIVLDRPVIYLHCPEYFEKTLKTAGYQSDPDYVKNDPRANAGRHVGVVVNDLSELQPAVRESLDDPSRLSKLRGQLVNKLLYNPGRGGEAAARKIIELRGKL